MNDHGRQRPPVKEGRDHTERDRAAQDALRAGYASERGRRGDGSDGPTRSERRQA